MLVLGKTSTVILKFSQSLLPTVQTNWGTCFVIMPVVGIISLTLNISQSYCQDQKILNQYPAVCK